MTSEDKKKYTERLIERMEAADLSPWKSPYLRRPAVNLATGKEYKGAWNRLSLAMQSEQTASSFFGTYNQIKSLGGQVKKGEKGALVFRPLIFDGKKNDAEAVDENEGKSTRKRVIFRPFFVFAHTQAEFAKTPPVIEDWNAFNSQFTETSATAEERGARLLASMRDVPPIAHGGNRAFYSPPEDRIQVPEKADFLSTEHYYATLYHEIAHSTGHPSRLHRFSASDKPSLEQYSKEELVAEIASCFLLGDAGIYTPQEEENSAAYLKAWVSAIKSSPDLLPDAIQGADRVVDRLLPSPPQPQPAFAQHENESSRGRADERAITAANQPAMM